MKKQEYIDMWLQSWLSIWEIEKILTQIMNISSSELFILQEISSKYIYDAQKAFFQIQSGVPTEYTLQSANFYGRDFFVDSRVLIPRNDTELLVQKVLQHIHIKPYLEDTIYIDVGTGSGCIAVSIIWEMFPLRFQKSYALDLSSVALEVAKKNIDTHLWRKIEILQSNLLEVLLVEESIEWKNLLITANLPYIKNADFENMDMSVVKYEPHTALFWGEKTGFELYTQLIKQCFQIKHRSDCKTIDLFIEIGFDQYDISKQLLVDFGLSFEYFLDSASISRVIHITWF